MNDQTSCARSSSANRYGSGVMQGRGRGQGHERHTSCMRSSSANRYGSGVMQGQAGVKVMNDLQAV